MNHKFIEFLYIGSGMHLITKLCPMAFILIAPAMQNQKTIFLSSVKNKKWILITFIIHPLFRHPIYIRITFHFSNVFLLFSLLFTYHITHFTDIETDCIICHLTHSYKESCNGSCTRLSYKSYYVQKCHISSLNCCQLQTLDAFIISLKGNISLYICSLLQDWEPDDSHI